MLLNQNIQYDSYIINYFRVIQYIFDMELQQILKELNQLSNKQNRTDVYQIFTNLNYKNQKVLQTILSRVSSLYQFNEELQKNIMNIQMKMNKLSQDQENIHYQMRVNMNNCDQKINNVSEKCISLSSSRAIKQKKSKQYAQKRSERSYILDSDQIKQNSQQRQSQQQNQEEFNHEQKAENIKSSRKIFKQKLKKRQITFKVQQTEQQQKQYQQHTEYLKSEEKDVYLRRKNPKTSIHFIQNDGFQSQNFNERYQTKETSVRQMIQQKRQSRKTNLKKNKTFNQINDMTAYMSKTNLVTQKKLSNQKQQKCFQNILHQFENINRTNQKMKNNYEQLMQEYCNKNQKNFDLIQNQIKQIKNQINQINISLNLQKATNNKNFEQMKKQFDGKIKEMQKIEYLSKDHFLVFQRQILKQLQVLNQQRCNLVKKNQVKFALQNLDQKFLKALKQFKRQKSNIQVHRLEVDDKGCFKSNQNEHLNLSIVDDNKIQLSRLLRVSQGHRIKKPVSNQTHRQASSMHLRKLDGLYSQNRFNQKIDQIDKSLVKTNRQTHYSATRPSTSLKNRDQARKINELNKRSYDIISKQKNGLKRIKKDSGMIFQYD